MNEPEINIVSNEKSVGEKKKRYGLKVALSIIVLLIIVVVGGATYLKVVYNQDYLKTLCETEVSKAVGGKCEIKSIDWSLGGSVDVKGVSLAMTGGAGDDKPQFLNIDTLTAKINIIDSIINFQPVAELVIDGVQLRILRIINADQDKIAGNEQKAVLNTEADSIDSTLTGNNQEKFSTNVNRAIRSVANMPWKDMIAGFDWKIADVNVKISNVKVNVHDQSGALEDIDFMLNAAGRLKKTGAKLNLDIKQKTPDVKDGGITLAADILFDWDEADRRSDKPLAFIGSTGINLNITDLDIGYIGRYYIQSANQSVRPAEPLSGVVTVKADDLASVKFDVELNSKKLLLFYEDDKPVSQDGPGLDFSLRAEADLSKEWSTIKNGVINILSRDSGSNARLFKFDTQIFGSFADEIVTSIQSDIDLGAISKSAVGRVFDLYNIARGDVLFGSELTWKKNDNWGYEFNVRSKDLVIKNNSSAVPAPIAMLVSGEIKVVDQFSPEMITLQAKCNAPGVTLNTRGDNGILIPLNASKISLEGQADAKIDMPELFRAFDAPLKKFGLKSIDEILTMKFKVDSSNNAVADIEIMNTRNQYAPCTISISYQPKSGNSFIGNLELMAEKKAVQFKASVEGSVAQNDFTELVFSNQFAFRVGAGLNLLKRIQNIIPGLEVAQYPVSGVMRGSVNGKGIMNTGKLSLDVSHNILIEKMSFTTDSGKKFVDNKTSITGSFKVDDLLGEKILNVKSFNLKGDTADVELKAQRLGITALSSNFLAALDKLMDLSVVVRLGEKTFGNLSALLSGSVADILSTGKSLTVEVKSGADKSFVLNKFELISTGLSANISDLVVYPEKIINALNRNDMGAVVSSMSPFRINAKATNSFWKGIKLEPGLQFSGNAELDMAYNPKLDRLTLSKLIVAGDRDNKAFVTRVSAATIVDNVSKIITNPEMTVILDSLPKGVNVPVVGVSLPMLSQFMKSKGTELNIKGNTVELSNLRVVRAKQKDTLQIAGDLVSSGMGLDDMLVYKGSIRFNNLVRLSGDDFALTGEMNLDNAAIQFKAVPYIYRKSAGQKVKLYYKASGNNGGVINVDRAGISGGALQFDMSGMKYQQRAAGQFAFELPVFKLLAPFELTVSDVSINPDTDVVAARVVSKKISLDNMSASLDTGLPSKLSGYIGAINLEVNEKYSTLLGSGSQKLSPDSRFVAQPSSITLTSTAAESVKMNVGVGKIQGDTASGRLIIGGVNITSPISGFSEATPLKAGQIESVINLDMFAAGKKIIDEVVVSSFKAVYEMKLEGNNISALQKNIAILLPESSQVSAANAGRDRTRSVSGVSADKAVTGTPATESDDGILIKDLYLNNGVVAVKSKLINTEVKIPQTHVQNIGGDNPRVAFTTVLNVILQSIGKASVSILDQSAGNAVESVTNLLGNALQNKDKAGNEANSKNENPVKSITNLLNSVIKDDSGGEGGADKKSSNPLSNLFK